MIKTILMYSILTVSSFATAWITNDFFYSVLVPLLITAFSYYLYDEWVEMIKNDKKKTSATTEI